MNKDKLVTVYVSSIDNLPNIVSAWFHVCQSESALNEQVLVMFLMDEDNTTEPLRPIVDTPWDSYNAFSWATYNKVYTVSCLTITPYSGQ